MAPLPIELPKPMFEGTPQNLNVPNVERPLGRPRDPFLAPAGVTNVALDKAVDSSDREPIIGDLEQVTDGDKMGAEGSYVELGPGLHHVTIDLGEPHEIYAVLFWHFHKTARIYLDVVVRWPTTPPSRRTSERSSTTTTTRPRGWERARP